MRYSYTICLFGQLRAKSRCTEASQTFQLAQAAFAEATRADSYAADEVLHCMQPYVLKVSVWGLQNQPPVLDKVRCARGRPLTRFASALQASKSGSCLPVHTASTRTTIDG